MTDQAPAIRGIRVLLFGLDNTILGAVRLVIAGDEFPQVVMADGEPYLPMPTPPNWENDGVRCYRLARPYFVDLSQAVLTAPFRKAAP